MYFTRILLSIVFVLFASAALAEKPGNELVCHVGNELGSLGETYQDNPDCTIPDGWEGDYICPDAGKVDLILVSTKAFHVGNPSHSYDDGGYVWEDYIPEVGIGDDPLDFEEGDVPGVDRGCELAQTPLTCPCWSTATHATLIAELNTYTIGPDDQPSCIFDAFAAQIEPAHQDGGPTVGLYAFNYLTTECIDSFRSQPPVSLIIDPAVAQVCMDEIAALIPDVDWCP